MTDCDKCRYKEVCRSLGEADLSCEDVERIAKDGEHDDR